MASLLPCSQSAASTQQCVIATSGLLQEALRATLGLPQPRLLSLMQVSTGMPGLALPCPRPCCISALHSHQTSCCLGTCHHPMPCCRTVSHEIYTMLCPLPRFAGFLLGRLPPFETLYQCPVHAKRLPACGITVRSNKPSCFQLRSWIASSMMALTADNSIKNDKLTQQ